MIHEPECFYGGLERYEDDWYDAEDDPCICDQIQTAYQRGRDAAAKAIAEAWRDTHILRTIIDAALGDQT